MEKPKSILLSVLVVALLCSFAAIASAHTFLFELTCNYPSPVPAGTSVTMTFKTNDQRVTQVLFIWKNSTNQIRWQDTVPVYKSGDFWYADSTHTPDEHGTWTVEAYSNQMTGKGTCVDTITIERRDMFFVVPENPLGTLGLISALALAFGIFALKKKKQ